MIATRPPASPFQLLVFDWDGTVMDSIGAIVACTLHTLDELGMEPLPEARIRGAVGLSSRESLDHLFPGVQGDERRVLSERARHHWLATYRHRLHLIAGAAEALRRLAARGYFLAVATGKSRAGLDRDLEVSGLGELFLATRTADDAASKPHPQMLLDLVDELGVRPGETLMIGDTTFDLEMAANAGSPAVGVLSGSHPRETLLDCGPLALLDSVAELPAWLAEARR